MESYAGGESSSSLGNIKVLELLVICLMKRIIKSGSILPSWLLEGQKGLYVQMLPKLIHLWVFQNTYIGNQKYVSHELDSWFLVESIIAATFCYCKTTKMLWDSISESYALKRNHAITYQLTRLLTKFKLGDMTLGDKYARLKRYVKRELV